MPNRHAILGPSAAYRWLACTPSARFEEQIPEDETDYAAEGTLAHDLAALILSARSGLFKGSQAHFNELLRDIEDKVKTFYAAITFGETDGAGEFYTMLEYAEEWAAIVCEYGGDILIEQEYDLSQFVPLGFGTSDGTNFLPEVLYVSDFKYGAGVRISAVENEQMMLYGVGALIKAVELGHKPTTVVLTIFQPRAGGVSTWQISVKDLLHWAEIEVRPKALLAIAGEGEFNPGDHCQFCKARTSCAAFFKVFAKVDKISDKRVMKPEDTAYVLEHGATLKTWINKVQDAAVRQLERRQKIPGYKLVKGRGTRQFKNEDNVVDILLGENYEADKIFNTALKSLTDLEKSLGPKRFKVLFENEIFTKEGKPKVVPEGDDRIAIDASAADEYDDEAEDLL